MGKTEPEVAELRSVVARLEAPSRTPAAHRRTAALRPLFGTSLGTDGNLYTDLRIGMPLTGRCNLAESPLLKELRDEARSAQKQ